MTDDVFSKTGENEGEVNSLHELVGEGKKFSTLDELAKGKLEADQFIEQLKGELSTVRSEMATLEEQANKKATVSDLIEAVKKTNSKVDEEGNQPISEEQLKEMVDSIMDNRYEKQTRLTNYQQANQSVLDKFNGDVEAARTYMAERARELSLTTDKLKALGEESPSAFKQLMEQGQRTGSPQGVTGLPEVNVENRSNPHGVEVIDGHHTKAYYNKLKMDLGPAKYWNDPKIQGAYFKDAQALGDRFNNQ